MIIGNFIQYIMSPLGLIEIRSTKNYLTSVNYVANKTFTTNKNALTNLCIEQLNDYFEGKRQSFNLPIKLDGTDFQIEVWQALQDIKYGKVCSYSDIAMKVKRPKAVRAVGNTNRLNPISIIIPCHRVIGKNKKLVGYAGGLDKKAWLLKHENI